MKQIPRLETKRLILRPFENADAADVMRLAGDRAIADTTLNIPHPYREGMAEDWISSHQDSFNQGRGVTFAVTRKSDGALIGAVSLMGMTRDHQAELGYWVGKPHWKQGYCTEAARAVLKFAFCDLALVRVHASHFTRNPASGRVMQKIGMRKEGCRRQHVTKWGKLEDLDLYGILKQEWEDKVHKSFCADVRRKMPTTNVKDLNVLAVYVTDLNRSETFYREHLGFEKVADMDPGILMKAGQVMLYIEPGCHQVRCEETAAAEFSPCFATDSVRVPMKLSGKKVFQSGLNTGNSHRNSLSFVSPIPMAT